MWIEKLSHENSRLKKKINAIAKQAQIDMKSDKTSALYRALTLLIVKTNTNKEIHTQSRNWYAMSVYIYSCFV